MRAARRIAGNTLVILLGRAFGMVLSLAVVFLLTAYLPKKEFGLYNFVFFYIGVFSVVTEMGLSPILVREMARHREEAGEILGTGILVKSLTALVSFFLALVVLPLIQPEGAAFRLVAILGLQLFVYPVLTCTNIFKLELKMGYTVAADSLRHLIFLLGAWFLLTTPRFGLAHLMAWTVFLAFAFSVFLWIAARRFVRIRLVWRPELARRLIRAALPLGLSQLAIVCYYRIDTMMLIRMKGEEAVAYYSLAVKVAEVFSYVASAFLASVYPFLSRFWNESREKFTEAAELALRALVAAALPISLMGAFFAGPILSIIPGGYGESANSLVFLIWAEFFIFLNTAFYNFLNAMDRERWNLWTTLVMLAGNVALNLVLIPWMSHPGASLATLVTEGFGLLLLGGYFLHRIGYRLPLRRIFRTLFAGGLLALGLYWLPGKPALSFWQALIPMAVGTGLYVGVLYLVKVLDIREIINLMKSTPEPEIPPLTLQSPTKSDEIR
jgi:O-antigen/teichoic acid export membrane protein